eukprot:3985506-Ditylum_brightwellii.AAC.1
MFLLAKALTFSSIKNLRNEDHKYFSEKSDDIILAGCYTEDRGEVIPLYSYPLNFKLIQKEQQKDNLFLAALKKSN